MSEIKVEVNIQEEDIYRFQKRVFYQRISPLTIIAINIVVTLIAIFSLVDRLSKGLIPSGSIALLLVPIYFIIILPISFKRASRNTLNTNKLLQKTQTYVVNEEGVSITSETGNAFIKWTDFYKTLESKESFLIFISKQQAYIIPKRSLENNQEEILFLKKCLSNVPIPKDEKGGFFRKTLRYGLILYILLFVVILATLFALGR